VVVVTLVTFGPVRQSLAADVLSAKDAAAHVGELATVCGVVASAKYSTSTKGEPTFLNLDEPYPSQVFTVLIWGSNRAAFGAPESKYAHKSICVTGKIQEFKGKPEIVATQPGQIQVKE
jgi:micrococcal nuclease